MTDARAAATETVLPLRRSARDAAAAADAAAARLSWVGALWSRDPEGERAAAASVDAAKRARQLSGITVTVKDCIDVAGLPTTWGVAGAIEPAISDAEAVRRLRTAGAVVVGKSAMDQLAWTVSGEAPGFPRCVNPTAPLLSPGGSSAGSAAAVAAGIVAVGLGTDLAGSVRIPAACCGVVGFKPTPGAVPLDGFGSLVPEVDSIGVLARSVDVARAAYEVLAAVSVLPALARRIRVGILTDVTADAPPELQKALRETLARTGVDIAPLQLGWRPRGLGRIFSSALSRRVGGAVSNDPAAYTEDVRRSVRHGLPLTDAQVADALTALRSDRTDICRELRDFDVVVTPTLLTDVPRRDEVPQVNKLTEATRIFSALGWAAAAIPIAGTSPSSHPASLQLACAPGNESKLFALALRVESVR